MSARYLHPSPEECLVVGFGGICLDYLAVVSTFPKPDDKTRSRSMKVQGGGDAANALTCLARLGVTARLISKIADDVHGRSLLEELRADGVDASFLVVAEDGRTPFSYVIVDQSTRTRTCIFTPGFPLMEPADISPALTSAVEGARFVYFDARYTDTAIVVAKEAVRQNIPILLDAEKKRRGLDDLLELSDYVVCSAKFPKAWTEAPSMPSALISMLLRLPKLKFAIVTLGEHGCLMLERSSEENPLMGEEDADSLLHSLEQKKDDSVAEPKCFPSVMCFSNRREKNLLVEPPRCAYLGAKANLDPSHYRGQMLAGDCQEDQQQAERECHRAQEDAQESVLGRGGHGSLHADRGVGEEVAEGSLAERRVRRVPRREEHTLPSQACGGPREAKGIGLPNFLPRTTFLTVLQRKVKGIASKPPSVVARVRTTLREL
ncbi:PfkB domain-containing protein [Psidium guajava]|nr:PfkB domain-containing protein [Psidium guajava]